MQENYCINTWFLERKTKPATPLVLMHNITITTVGMVQQLSFPHSKSNNSSYRTPNTRSIPDNAVTSEHKRPKGKKIYSMLKEERKKTKAISLVVCLNGACQGEKLQVFI